MISPSTISLYFRANRDLIPISKTDPHKGKRPLHKEWTSRQYSRAEIRRYAANGYNLGWRLGANDLVIDIDSRNGGLESIKSLCSELGLDFEQLKTQFPTVETGGGGFHVYTTIQSHLRTIETDKAYPGLEFKRRNRQVIIPDSIHPRTGSPYRWYEPSPYQSSSIPVIPSRLLKWLIDRTDQNRSGSTPNPAQISPAELAKLLEAIPVTDYADNDSWFRLLAAAHSATGGAGLAEFLAWSLADPVYADHENMIRARWNSLEDKKETLITAATLFRAAGQYDSNALHEIAQAQARADFGRVEIGEKSAPQKSETRADLESRIDALTPQSKPKEIESVLRRLLSLRSLERNQAIDRIRTRIGQSRAAINESLRDLKKEQRKAEKADGNKAALEDIAEKAVTLLLRNKYANGKHILHGADQRFWTYSGKYWEVRPPNLIQSDLLGACERLKVIDPGLEFVMSSTMRQAETILRARVATSRDMYRLRETPPSVVNMKNFEVWIDPLTGEIETKKHDPANYLINYLDIDYNPKAKAPLFEETIAGIAATDPNPAEWTRHLYEILGYSLQPLKDIAIWVLLQGYGSNGKSFILTILSSIVGNAALEKSVKELSSDYAHAYADLPGKLVVIDEDLKAGTLLPDDTLKKISENKILTANPKHSPQFQFKSSSIIIMASNSWPQTRDLSDGMRRRAMVIPFRRQFTVAEMDTRRAAKVIEAELSGVVNILLGALMRLRGRGYFKVPDSCQVSAEQWVTESHPFNAFLAQNFDRSSRKFSYRLDRAWNRYTIWTIENHIQNPLSKISFSRALRQCGHSVKRKTKGYMFVEGLKPIFEEEEGSLW